MAVWDQVTGQPKSEPKLPWELWGKEPEGSTCEPDEGENSTISSKTEF